MQHIEQRKSRNRRFYIVVKADNGEVLITSPLYDTELELRYVVSNLNENRYEIEKRQRLNGKPYYAVVSKEDNELLGVSEHFSSNQMRDKSITALLKVLNND